MMDFMFFVKTFCLTVVIVVLMQIRIGSQSIEGHAMGAIQSSMIVSPLNSVARGAAKLVRDVTQNISARVKSNTKKTKKEEGSKKEEDEEEITKNPNKAMWE